MIPISLCIITKNEADYLNKCLSYVKDYNFELVVVDTGSEDRSLEIARTYTDHVYSFSWVNDFSAARNYAVSKAANDWILFLDTDEYVYELDVQGLLAFTEAHPTAIGEILLTSTDAGGATAIERLGRFFNRKHYRYERPVHEQLVPISKTGKSSCYPVPVAVNHVGYSGDKTQLSKKANRNLELLLASLTDYPDAYTYYQIGQCYYIMSDWENACIYFEKGLSKLSNYTSDYAQLMVINYGYCLDHLGKPSEAIAFLEPLQTSLNFLADYAFLLGFLYMETKNYMKAALNLIRATTLSDCKVEGTNSYRAFYNIGALYEMMGDKAMARSFYEKCGNYTPAVQRLDAIS